MEKKILSIIPWLIIVNLLSQALFLQSTAKPTERVKFTLDPKTLAEAKALIKATNSPPTTSESGKVIDIGFRLKNSDNIFFEYASSKEALTMPRKVTSSSINETHKCSNRKEGFHLASGKCYTLGLSGGPCGENMVFYAQEDNKLYGDCDCNYNAEFPLVFHQNSAKCYPIYEQAYCKTNEWLVFDELEMPVCEPRRCVSDESVTMVYFHGRCVEYDKWDKDCKNEYEKVIFKEHVLQPVCGEDTISEQGNFNVPKLQCKPGSSQDLQGHCRQKIKFNLNG